MYVWGGEAADKLVPVSLSNPPPHPPPSPSTVPYYLVSLAGVMLGLQVMLPLPEKRRGRTPGGAKHQQRQQLENKNHGLIARLKRIWAFKTKLVGVTDTHMGKYFVLKLAVVEICEGSSQGCVRGRS